MDHAEKNLDVDWLGGSRGKQEPRKCCVCSFLLLRILPLHSQLWQVCFRKTRLKCSSYLLLAEQKIISASLARDIRVRKGEKTFKDNKH